MLTQSAPTSSFIRTNRQQWWGSVDANGVAHLHRLDRETMFWEIENLQLQGHQHCTAMLSFTQNLAIEEYTRHLQQAGVEHQPIGLGDSL